MVEHEVLNIVVPSRMVSRLNTIIIFHKSVIESKVLFIFTLKTNKSYPSEYIALCENRLI